MPLTRESIRASVERAGDEHWDRLIRHHEDPYPRPTPTPGDVCREEAARLTALGFGERADLELERSLVLRIGEEVELVHCFRVRATGREVRTDPFRNYAPAGPA